MRYKEFFLSENLSMNSQSKQHYRRSNDNIAVDQEQPGQQPSAKAIGGCEFCEFTLLVPLR